MHLKQVFVFLFVFLFPVLLLAQQRDSQVIKRDSPTRQALTSSIKRDSAVAKKARILKPDSNAKKRGPVVKPDSFIEKRDPVLKNDSAGEDKRDSIAVNPDSGRSKRADSLRIAKTDADRILKGHADSIRTTIYFAAFQQLIKDNKRLNWFGQPVAMTARVKKFYPGDYFFYFLAVLALLLGFFRFFYTRYFNNLFRVFFNASLRQSQLTDQLLQAKLPSLFFNIIFVFAGGIYVYLLLRYYNWISADNFWLVLLYCTLSLGAIYLIKFVSLKFTGWLTGYKEVTNTYVFIIFLINKILAVLLVPFSVIIAFSVPELVTAAVIISLLLIILMFLLRFFRSYGLLQHKLKISRLHFLLYVVGIEILPVLLIYKGLVLLLSKNI